MASGELSRTKSLIVLAVVVGCFAILWPKIFYPMFQTSVTPPTVSPPTANLPPKEQFPGGLCCGVVFDNDDATMALAAEVCAQVLKQPPALALEHGGRPPDAVLQRCTDQLRLKCGVDVAAVLAPPPPPPPKTEPPKSKSKTKKKTAEPQTSANESMVRCLRQEFDIDIEAVLARKTYAVHPPFIPRHMRPERPEHLHPDAMHPALREKGRVLPSRTIDRQAKPGPMPGMRPPMGGPGHMVAPPAGSGMSILMPLYTIGIIIFFLYTIMRIAFKKQDDEERVPLIKDFHMDPEQRKFVFAEEYVAGSDMSIKSFARAQDRLDRQRRTRSRTPEPQLIKEEELAEERAAVVDEAVAEKAEAVAEAAATEESAPVEEAAPETSDDLDAANGVESVVENVESIEQQKRSLRLAFAALKAQKEAEVDQLRRRLEETERAMERIVAQMENVSDRLSPTLMADLLVQSQCPDQDKAMADEGVGAVGASKGSSPDMEEYEVVPQPAGGEGKTEGAEVAGTAVTQSSASDYGNGEHEVERH